MLTLQGFVIPSPGLIKVAVALGGALVGGDAGSVAAFITEVRGQL
jgi:hypothetical protein